MKGKFVSIPIEMIDTNAIAIAIGADQAYFEIGGGGFSDRSLEGGDCVSCGIRLIGCESVVLSIIPCLAAMAQLSCSPDGHSVIPLFHPTNRRLRKLSIQGTLHGYAQSHARLRPLCRRHALLGGPGMERAIVVPAAARNAEDTWALANWFPILNRCSLLVLTS